MIPTPYHDDARLPSYVASCLLTIGALLLFPIALIWTLADAGAKSMNAQRVLELKIQALQGDETLSAQQRSQLLDGLVEFLRTRPELDRPFLSRYVKMPVDEVDLMTGLSILTYLGRQRPFDHKPLMDLIECQNTSLTALRSATTCVVQLANQLELDELLRLVQVVPAAEIVSTYCKLMDSLSMISDRQKARRVLSFCLRGARRHDLREQFFLLTTFVQRVEDNRDIYASLLEETGEPHETVLIAVSLMRGEGEEVGSRLRAMVDRAIANSPIAASYFHLYASIYQHQQSP